jgi:hypothetical protein
MAGQKRGGEMSKGRVEALSIMGVSGWAVGRSLFKTKPALVSIYLSDELVGKVVAREHRADVQEAGISKDGRCGFKYFFSQPLKQADLPKVRVVVDGGRALSRIGDRSFDIYDLLFDGSYGRDSSVPFLAFLSTHYIRHNARRLEHLAALRLPLMNRSVVEFGAGVGDHTSFYLDRGCTVLATDARDQNLDLLTKRLSNHPHRERVQTKILNVEIDFDLGQVFDVVHCYGLLYHVANGDQVIASMAKHCKELLLLETKTNPDLGSGAMYGQEESEETYHSFSGTNFRPTREWLHSELKKHFEYVYWPVAQPSHEEFARDFNDLSEVPDGWPRAIVIASKVPLDVDSLVTSPPKRRQNRLRSSVCK